MSEPTGPQRDAASVIFNLSEYRVVDAVDEPGGARSVTVESTTAPGCPGCGVVASRRHSGRLQRIRDVELPPVLIDVVSQAQPLITLASQRRVARGDRRRTTAMCRFSGRANIFGYSCR